MSDIDPDEPPPNVDLATLGDLSIMNRNLRHLIRGKDDKTNAEAAAFLNQESTPIDVRPYLVAFKKHTPVVMLLALYLILLMIERKLETISTLLQNKLIVAQDAFQLQDDTAHLIQNYLCRQFFRATCINNSTEGLMGDFSLFEEIMGLIHVEAHRTEAAREAVHKFMKATLTDSNTRHNLRTKVTKRRGKALNLAIADTDLHVVGDLNGYMFLFALARNFIDKRDHLDLEHIPADPAATVTTAKAIESWGLTAYFARLLSEILTQAQRIRLIMAFLEYDKLLNSRVEYIAECRRMAGEAARGAAIGPDFETQVSEFRFWFDDPDRALPWPFPTHPRPRAQGQQQQQQQQRAPRRQLTEEEQRRADRAAQLGSSSDMEVDG